MLQLELAASGVLHVLFTVKLVPDAPFGPETVNGTAELLVFCTVTVMVCVVEPWATLPKATVVGLTFSDNGSSSALPATMPLVATTPEVVKPWLPKPAITPIGSV